jgi:type VI secretion system secreted protein Hcp
MKRSLLGCLVVLVAVGTTAPSYAEPGLFFVTIQGAKQGKFKGESLRQGLNDRIEALKLSYEAASPRDVASGQAAGRRQHKPLVITKEWGPATPQILQALVTNEVLIFVLIEFFALNPQGQLEMAHSIRLTNAAVASVKQFTEKDQRGIYPQEEVSFVFQKIEVVNLRGKTAVADDWVHTP